jgi:hypothetical protein
VTALIPVLSCRSCRPNAPFAELVCLSKSSVAEEYYAERSGNKGSTSSAGPAECSPRALGVFRARFWMLCEGTRVYRRYRHQYRVLR